MSATPRVFVSSVVDGFKDFRAAAKRGVESAGAEAVLVNEDQPASSSSSRNACFDLVESSDLLVVIIGDRGGWTTPSGKLVVEEEFEHARKRKIPQLAFLQNVKRDDAATRFVAVLSDYTDGVFRRTFSTHQELEELVESAVRNTMNPMSLPTTSPEVITSRLSASERNGNHPSLRFAIAPERREEVITPMVIESGAFAKKILELGHSGENSIFSYVLGKDTSVNRGVLTIEQAADRRSWGDSITVRLDEAGIIEVERGLGGARRDQFAAGTELQADDIIQALQACFGFAGTVYRHLDPHSRHRRFLWGAAISDLGYRLITRDTSRKTSYGMSTSRPPGPLVAFDEPRLTDRRDLEGSTEEVMRALTLLERKAKR